MDRTIIGAFSEEQVTRLTGLSRAQLRRWNSNSFIRPEYHQATSNVRSAFTFIYSFKDLLKLRVLNQLRNVFSVSMPELRKVEKALAHLGDDKWTSTKLWVHNRKVVFVEPESHRKREIASKQFIVEIALEVVTTDARNDIRELNKRGEGKAGVIERHRHLHSSDPVFAGTRIPVVAIQEYMENGYSDGAIIKEFPDLSREDLDAARAYNKEAA